MHTAYQGKAADRGTKLPVLHSGPSEPNFIKEFLESYFGQWAETSAIQSELHSYILFCIFTNQTEQLHNDQSE